jgi:polyisoprenoid-binding protein YceI
MAFVNNELSAGEWTLDTATSSVGFQAKAAFGLKVNGRFDLYESAITKPVNVILDATLKRP